MDSRRKLRICHLGKYYPPSAGGMETHVQTLAQAQAALGADVRVVCVDHTTGKNKPETNGDLDGAPSGTPAEAHWEQDGAVRVLRMPRRSSLNRLDWCPGLPDVLRGIVRDGNDVLHLHTPNPTMLLALATARVESTLVITHHSDIIRQKVLRWFLRPFERIVYARAARIQTTSHVYPAGSSFLARYKERLDALPLGVDLAPYRRPSQAAQKYSEELRRKYDGPLWLAVGRLVYYKALHVAIRALANVPGRLIVIGTGPLEAELKQLAKEVGVSDRIIWRGYARQDELIGSYCAADALWFPSNARSEAFGLVQVEAMACGCPVINAEIAGSGVPWVSPHEQTGLTVPTNDPSALAKAAWRLLEDRPLRRRLSAAARQRASAEFDHLVMANRSFNIYGKALNGHRAALEAAIGHPIETIPLFAAQHQDVFAPAPAPQPTRPAPAPEPQAIPQADSTDVPRFSPRPRRNSPAPLRPAAGAP